MSEKLHFFATPHRCTAAILPFDLEERWQHWAGLRKKMVRQVPEPFTRDEWAYLAAFLDEANLRKPFLESFGEIVRDGRTRPSSLVRPRGLIGIWLPNNVSLLGPLTLILASFSGAPLRVKTGSNAADLTAAFVDYAVRNLADGALADYLRHQVRIERFDRQDPRNARMAAEAKVRLVFGSDATVNAVHALPHPPDSVAVSFGDHRSEAWVEKEALTEERMTALIRVFAIYGQAGCTSPRRVVVLDGSNEDARALQESLAKLWPKAVRTDVPMHVAAANVMEFQLAVAQGWQAVQVHRNGGVLAAGRIGLPELTGLMTLPVVSAGAAEAIASLPPNIQTIGHCLRDPHDPRWLELIARTPAKRFVPIEAMHHFGPVWDGGNYWRQFFEEVELQP
jgi:Acyl-CoA reductase (LuxC)